MTTAQNRAIKCPVCKSENIKRILYGLRKGGSYRRDAWSEPRLDNDRDFILSRYEYDDTDTEDSACADCGFRFTAESKHNLTRITLAKFKYLSDNLTIYLHKHKLIRQTLDAVKGIFIAPCMLIYSLFRLAICAVDLFFWLITLPFDIPYWLRKILRKHKGNDEGIDAVSERIGVKYTKQPIPIKKSKRRTNGWPKINKRGKLVEDKVAGLVRLHNEFLAYLADGNKKAAIRLINELSSFTQLYRLENHENHGIYSLTSKITYLMLDYLRYEKSLSEKDKVVILEEIAEAVDEANRCDIRVLKM